MGHAREVVGAASLPRQFDLIALGTGSAAATVATACREAGWQVAVVDALPYGGTCALRGCDPKKVLVGAAEVVDWCRRVNGKGVRADHARIDWAELMRFKRSFTDPVPGSREELFRRLGIAAFHGRARFSGPQSVEVRGETLSARHVVIATGAKPRPLRIPGERLVITSDDFLELERLPEEMVFVGGGYIAFEFAHIAARAGVRATILHRGKRPLEQFDAELVERLVEQTRKQGVDVRVNTPVTGVERLKDAYTVHTGLDGAAASVSTRLVVHAAGRQPDIEDLQLDAAGIEATSRGITVNGYLQSVSNGAAYAAGDSAASGAPLTPVPVTTAASWRTTCSMATARSPTTRDWPAWCSPSRRSPLPASRKRPPPPAT